MDVLGPFDHFLLRGLTRSICVGKHRAILRNVVRIDGEGGAASKLDA